MDKNYIGVYYNESELLDKVEELKAKGYSDDNIYVIAKDDSKLSMLRSRTSAEIQTADNSNGSWLDRFMNFLSGDNHVHGMLDRLGFDPVESERYYKDIDHGGMLLYVDEGEANRFYAEDHDFFGVHDEGTDRNLGANTVTDSDMYLGRDNNLDTTLPEHDQLGRVGGEAVLDRPVYDVDTDLYDTEEERMRLREERLHVNKHEVQRGEVRLEKNIVEEDQAIDVNVKRDEVYIERRPVTDGELYDDIDGARMVEDDETIRIPVTEERLEVTKKPVVTEEIILGKREVEDHETVHDTVKREEAHIEREGDVDLRGDILDDRSRDKL